MPPVYIIIGFNASGVVLGIEGDTILAVRYDLMEAQAILERENKSGEYETYRLEGWNESGRFYLCYPKNP